MCTDKYLLAGMTCMFMLQMMALPILNIFLCDRKLVLNTAKPEDEPEPEIEIEPEQPSNQTQHTVVWTESEPFVAHKYQGLTFWDVQRLEKTQCVLNRWSTKLMSQLFCDEILEHFCFPDRNDSNYLFVTINGTTNRQICYDRMRATMGIMSHYITGVVSEALLTTSSLQSLFIEQLNL